MTKRSRGDGGRDNRRSKITGFSSGWRNIREFKGTWMANYLQDVRQRVVCTRPFLPCEEIWEIYSNKCVAAPFPDHLLPSMVATDATRLVLFLGNQPVCMCYKYE